jgi:endonuclease/exonuclease/phosphatase family metal-dependent hydrolase
VRLRAGDPDATAAARCHRSGAAERSSGWRAYRTDALVDHPAGPLLLVNLHLTHLRDAGDLRSAQLDTILGQPWLQGQGTARLLCGDSNATLDAPELASLLDGSRGWDVRDAYQAGGGTSPRHTVHPDASLHGGSTVARCIDYIFSLATSPADQPTFTSSAIVLNRPDSESAIHPSDHFGVMMTMSLEASSAWSSAYD